MTRMKTNNEDDDAADGASDVYDYATNVMVTFATQNWQEQQITTTSAATLY